MTIRLLSSPHSLPTYHSHRVSCQSPLENSQQQAVIHRNPNTRQEPGFRTQLCLNPTCPMATTFLS